MSLPAIRLSTAARLAMRTTSRPPLSVLGRRHMTTLGDSYKGKEKVEEELYIRKKEKEALDRLRNKLFEEQKQLLEQYEKDVHDEVVAPTISEIVTLLEETGDKVSPEGLENLAKWHQDHPAPRIMISVPEKESE